jgi:hypothetical protein
MTFGYLFGDRTIVAVQDRSGIAATEFAVIVPIMLVMFFGTVEFSTGVAIDRKYIPTIGYVMAPSGVLLADVAYTRPRNSTCVFYPPPPPSPANCPTF